MLLLLVFGGEKFEKDVMRWVCGEIVINGFA
jgi:hypothetical protein